jgi:spore germination cell wall hydrolase CwlJ-like protein
MIKIFTLLVTGFVLSVLISFQVKAKQNQVDCVAKAIYFEARGEPFEGQLAVANVINNRVKSSKFPNTHCGVVHQAKRIDGKIVKNKCAFSFYCDGKVEEIRDKKAYKLAENIAKLSMQGVYVDIARKATHFHAVYVNPYWSKHLEYLGKIGKHNLRYE